jgi:hypothetical protein
MVGQGGRRKQTGNNCTVEGEETELSACSNGSLGWNRIYFYLSDFLGQLVGAPRSLPPALPSRCLRFGAPERKFVRGGETAEFSLLKN